MEKELPGSPAPNEPIKPKAPETNVLKFEFPELSFDGAFTMEDEKFYRFFVNRGKDSFFIETPKDVYFDFFETFADLHEEAENNDACTCSECVITDFEEVDEVNIIIKGINADTNEEVLVDENYKVYLVYNIAESLTFGLHDSHNTSEPTKD